MELNKINSLVELFFEKYKEKKELTEQPFLKWLKIDDNNFLTWKQVKDNICLFSEHLKKSSTKLLTLFNSIIWWAKRESNSHFLQNTILSRARLPIPPFALNCLIIY